MDGVKRAITRIFAWSMFITLLLPIGLFMTIFGGINRIWALLGVGIACIVIGFYGCPLIWVKYANAISYKRIVSAVAVEHIFSIKQIATHLNQKENIVLDKVDACIRREYLIGYIREGDTIRPNVNVYTQTAGYKCKACGARYELPVNVQPKCPYCGTVEK